VNEFFVTLDETAAAGLRVVDLKNKPTVLHIPRPPEMDRVPAIALSPDRKFLIVETIEPPELNSSVLEVWDWAAQRRVQQLEPRLTPAHPGPSQHRPASARHRPKPGLRTAGNGSIPVTFSNVCFSTQ